MRRDKMADMNEMHCLTDNLDDYEAALHAARAHFALYSAMGALLDPLLDSVLLERFLIYFSALGVHLTEPVESWVRRAGRRCEEMGLQELGRGLRDHAKRVSGRQRWMIDDARALVTRWNARRTPVLDADRLLRQPPTAGGRMYAQLHEHTIAGITPFAQIAIEYEMEMLRVRYGPPLIEQCIRLLGPDIVDGLSFLREPGAVDASPGRYLEGQLARLLEIRPEYAPALIDAGARALDAYGTFLIDCYHLAHEQAWRAGMSGRASSLAPACACRATGPPQGGIQF